MSDYNAGTAYISVRPDFSEFSSDISAQMDEQGAQAAEAFSASFRAELDGSLSDIPHVTVAADADTAPLDAQLDEATASRVALIGAEAQTDLAQADLDAAAAGRTAVIDVDEVGAAEADADLDEVAHERTAVIGVDDAATEAQAAAVGAELDEAARARTATIGVDASDVTDATTEATALDTALKDTTKPKKVSFDSSDLKEAGENAKSLGMVMGALTFAPSLIGAASILGGVGAGFVAAAQAGGGFDAVAKDLEADFESGAKSASGFSTALKSTGTSGLVDFKGAASDAGAAIGTLFTDLSPEIKTADGFIVDIASDFEKWAKSVNASDIENFFTRLFGGINIGELATDLSDIGGVVVKLVDATEDLSPMAMFGLTDFLDVLKTLPVPVVEALILLFGAIKAVGAVNSFLEWEESFGKALSNIKDKLTGLFAADADAGAAAAAGTEAGEEYAGGVAEGAEGTAGVGEIAAAELADGAGTAEGAGAATGAAYAGGMGETAADGAAAIGDVVGAELAAGAAPAAEAGEMVGAGFAAGIAVSGAEAEAEAAEIAETVDATLAAALEIESPSKVAFRRGANFGLGFANGIASTKDIAADAAGSLAEASVGSLSGLAEAHSLASLGAVGAASSLPGVNGPMGGGAMQMQVTYAGGSDELTTAIVKSLRFSIQGATGGDVQAHLGRGKVRT